MATFSLDGGFSGVFSLGGVYTLAMGMLLDFGMGKFAFIGSSILVEKKVSDGAPPLGVF